MRPERRIAIGVVARETGIPKETLRIWERRYGFPRPARSSAGERLYEPEQVDTLRLVKQLLDRGFRPAAVLGQSRAQLRGLVEQLTPAGGHSAMPDPVAAALALVRGHRFAEFQHWLQHRLHQDGLRSFVLSLARPLCTAVGLGWECGELAVFEEHLVSEQLQQLLRGAIGALPRPTHGPRILLTTVPGEEHGFGLLMLEALLSLSGADCLSLGLQTPVGDILSCCNAERFDAIALSFSAFFPPRRARTALGEVRAGLDRRTSVWAGGASAAALAARLRLQGVTVMAELEDALAALDAMLGAPPDGPEERRWSG